MCIRFFSDPGIRTSSKNQTGGKNDRFIFTCEAVDDIVFQHIKSQDEDDRSAEGRFLGRKNRADGER